MRQVGGKHAAETTLFVPNFLSNIDQYVDDGNISRNGYIV
jgi:hypothetical protein